MKLLKDNLINDFRFLSIRICFKYSQLCFFLCSWCNSHNANNISWNQVCKHRIMIY